MDSIVMIDIMSKNNHDAGTKARNDVTNILDRAGFNSIVMFNRTHGYLRRSIEIVSALRKLNSKVNGGGNSSSISLQF